MPPTHSGLLSNTFKTQHGGIAVALLSRVLLFSTTVTLVLTVVEQGYASGLGNALWALDSRQLQDQLDGMLHLPLIRYVEVRETQVPHPLKGTVNLSAAARTPAKSQSLRRRSTDFGLRL